MSGYIGMLFAASRLAALLPDPQGSYLDGWPLFCQVVLRIVSPFLAFLAGAAIRRRFRR